MTGGREVNEENLINKNKSLTREQKRELLSKAGKRSAQVKKEKKAMREVTTLILGAQAPISKQAVAKLAKQFGIPQKDITVQFVATLEQSKKALKGDRAALEYLRDTAGENVKDMLKAQEIAIKKAIAKDNAFDELDFGEDD